MNFKALSREWRGWLDIETGYSFGMIGGFPCRERCSTLVNEALRVAPPKWVNAA